MTTRRTLLSAVAAGAMMLASGVAVAQDKITLRLSSVNTETDSRATGLIDLALDDAAERAILGEKINVSVHKVQRLLLKAGVLPHHCLDKRRQP